MKVGKLLHTRYRVNDLEQTVKFYKEVLGLAELRRHKSPRGSELVFMQADDSRELIELCSFPASGPVQVQPDLTHLAFEVESLDGFARHLASLGLKYSDGPTMRPGRRRLRLSGRPGRLRNRTHRAGQGKRMGLTRGVYHAIVHGSGKHDWHRGAHPMDIDQRRRETGQVRVLNQQRQGIGQTRHPRK